MASLQIGKYKRPGIFVEEYDQSVIASQTVTGITNLVIGVSKQGPINSPVLIQNTNDLQNIFGGIDRNLERKGSYFGRTIAKMLESTPVYAVNLLNTDDTLDKIQYAPLSTATDKTNDSIKEGAYRRFYNTVGFWRRDPDSFLTLTHDNAGYTDRILNLTNVSGNYITVFIFKTTATGFDTTMLNWYGSVDKIPTYVYPTDYASDYMVDVVVVAGDWSNYAVLSNDAQWSKYFDTTGLRKTQVQNFVNDATVTLLKYYQGLSFIPYFRDSNNQNIFIETVINQDTDTTGLFCAFDMDAFETDYPNGKIDLIGNNLLTNNSIVDYNVKSIDFLSYDETITQNVTYTNTRLDKIGAGSTTQVLAIHNGTHSGNTSSTSAQFRLNSLDNNYRTDWYAEEYISGVYRDNQSFSNTSATVRFNWDTNPYNGEDSVPYAIIGGDKVLISATATFTINASDYGSYSSTQSYYTTFKLDTTGTITKVSSLTANTKPSVATSDIVLGYYKLVTNSGKFVTGTTYTDVAVNSTDGYVDLIKGTDYTITSTGVDNTFVITFLSTSGVPSTANYEQYRRIKRSNAIRNVLESTNVSQASMLMNLQDGNDYVKVSLEGMTVTSVTSTTANKSITVKTNLGLEETTFTAVVNSIADNFVLYAKDDEQLFSDYQMKTVDTISTTLVGTSSYGIVAKYSDMYQDFYNGNINTGDYFYANILGSVTNMVYPVSVNIDFADISGTSYMIVSGTNSEAPFDPSSYNKIIVPDSTLNTGILNVAPTDPSSLATSLGYPDYVYAYEVSEAVMEETLTNVSIIQDGSTKYFLAMSLDSSDNLTVNITDSSLSTWQEGLGDILDLNQTLLVNSNDSNYEQSLELEIPANYTQSPNKVLVNAVRYSEISVGDFLEAYVDETMLEIGQVPKKLTRIIKKQLYSGDTSLVEITCDAQILKQQVGSKYQSMRYTSIDNYVNTYKAITLKGFRIREASLPDGTEDRQTEILNLVAKGTPLFKALTNKEAFDFRYLIDSFGLGLIANSKQQLMDICGARLNCLGFLNMPSIKAFKNSSSPSFVNSEGVLQVSYIAQGGDPQSSPAFLYSFGEGKGTTCAGYFTPYLTVSDNGRPLSVPPAMFAASTYMRKLNSGLTSIVPWTIAAGITEGRITGIAGLEIDYTPEDIEYLNQAQMNPIVVKKNRGWCIETENTAQTLYKSALSYLHVREVLIELENQLTTMLQDFQWKFNTADIRAEIKLRADVICAQFVNQNGLYNYFNKCDSENNTPDLIDNQVGVLDTYVEPIKGLQVIVNNITVLKTGAIQSGGFTTL